MKKILFCMLLMLTALCLSTKAEATLINRGADTLGNRLIYDDDLNITWYDYSNAVDTWSNQVAWAAGLSVTHNSNTYNDWRLPTTVDGPWVYGYDGTTTVGYNITTSEMGHLFYTELGNLGGIDTSGTPQSGYGLTNTGDFQNLVNSVYWSGTEHSAYNGRAWAFAFGIGFQYMEDKDYVRYGLAVRSGDVAAVIPDPDPVPEPATFALL